MLILAAITASFVGARRRLRRPVLIGAGARPARLGRHLGARADAAAVARSSYGEKLEAMVGLIAIGVLLLITNWFFHKVYWSEWIGKFHRRRKRSSRSSEVGVLLRAGARAARCSGLTSVYREGFETVLFLQSLELSAGTATVLEGAGARPGADARRRGASTFALQRKLPYKKMLIVTGVMIGFVLVVMVGQTARTMQGTGWLPITPIDVDLPYWLGLWFGVFPTVGDDRRADRGGAFVIGSYFLAREVRIKRPRAGARRGTRNSRSSRRRPVRRWRPPIRRWRRRRRSPTRCASAAARRLQSTPSWTTGARSGRVARHADALAEQEPLVSTRPPPSAVEATGPRRPSSRCSLPVGRVLPAERLALRPPGRAPGASRARSRRRSRVEVRGGLRAARRSRPTGRARAACGRARAPG